MEQIVTTKAEMARLLRMTRRQAAIEAFDAAFELGWEFGVSQQRHQGEEFSMYSAMSAERDTARAKYLKEV